MVKITLAVTLVCVSDLHVLCVIVGNTVLVVSAMVNIVCWWCQH